MPKARPSTILAQQLARAVSSRLTRQVAFDTERFSNEKGGSGGATKPHWTTKGMPLKEALNTAACLASVHAKCLEVTIPEPFILIGPPLSLLFFAALVAGGQRGAAPHPAPDAHWTPAR